MNGDVDAAMRLYWWNVEVSSAFYGPLHCLEIVLRNALHERLRERYDRDAWWTAAPLGAESLRKVDRAKEKARRKLTREGSRTLVPDDVVAELTFGFWVELFSRRNDRNFWVPTLHRAFTGYSGRRNVLHREFLSMVLFRNRIMHYEPIHHRELDEDHLTVYRLMGYIEQDLAKNVQRLDRVPAVLARRGDVCGGDGRSSF
ncbi:hypothetical protein [Actinomadura rifamycini]|uniref:hypothetical protein n=1 Tax=Actinomadura rifamycini TaxID=31962 RepID=UPI001FDF1AA7|nr:hypothetical protein [Actinomadura rifamycini]